MQELRRRNEFKSSQEVIRLLKSKFREIKKSNRVQLIGNTINDIFADFKQKGIRFTISISIIQTFVTEFPELRSKENILRLLSLAKDSGFSIDRSLSNFENVEILFNLTDDIKDPSELKEFLQKLGEVAPFFSRPKIYVEIYTLLLKKIINLKNKEQIKNCLSDLNTLAEMSEEKIKNGFTQNTSYQLMRLRAFCVIKDIENVLNLFQKISLNTIVSNGMFLTEFMALLLYCQTRYPDTVVFTTLLDAAETEIKKVADPVTLKLKYNYEDILNDALAIVKNIPTLEEEKESRTAQGYFRTSVSGDKLGTSKPVNGIATVVTSHNPPRGRGIRQRNK